MTTIASIEHSRCDATSASAHINAGPKSLALLAAKAAALARPLEEVAACLDCLPLAVRRELYAHLTHERLRGLEICWTHTQPQAQETGDASVRSRDCNGDDHGDDTSPWSLENETEHEWYVRSKISSGGTVPALHHHHHHHSISDRSVIGFGAVRKRGFREAFWEHRFRALLRARATREQWRNESADLSNSSSSSTATVCDMSVSSGTIDGTDDALMLQSHSATTRNRDCDNNDDASATLHLFRDVVRSLKVHGREVIPRNVTLMHTLMRLQRLEVHHPEQQRTCWRSLVQLIETHPSLTEVAFFHGKLSDTQLEQLRCALQTRARAAELRASTCSHDPLTGGMCVIATLELVSVKIRERGHSELVTLLHECRELTAVRLSNCLTGFANDRLVAHALALPHLTSLALEHNDLEDDAFIGLSTCRSSVALQQLKLDSNAVAAATLRGICTATLDGFVALRRLELRNNVDVGDASIHALAPMLAAADVALTHLDLNNCSFGLEGATTLLLALRTNTTLTHLDVGHNFFGSRFGDLLADFLSTNARLESLRMNYVGLGTAGCTEQLRDALAHNSSLVEVAIGANRLRDDGADMLFQALVERSRMLQTPYVRVDLSGNLLTHKALDALARTVEQAAATEQAELQQQQQQQRGSDSEAPRAKRQRVALPTRVWIRELSLLDNNFPRTVDATERAVASLRTRVEVVHTNPWVGKHNVYDDEI